MGVERGLYMNDTLRIHEDCFGPVLVEKINMLAAMFIDNVFYNIIPAVAIFY